jgi:L-asparaginase / beta-aspartyl-peptidase
MYIIAIHGGAGLSTPEILGPEREIIARLALKQSLITADEVLSKGGTALDAVVAAVCIMEDSPVFNAGKGSVFASDGVQYMDASIMQGQNKEAGALCGATIIQNPIKAARLVMENTRHVMMYGEDLHRLAREHNLVIVEQSWFHTEYRLQQLQEAKAAGVIILDHEKATGSKGTVGAVALDIHGNLAAATSTGGLCNKRPGRVGDSALIGAGTYAQNNTCAVSATGHGELFIRSNVAGRLSSMMEFGGLTLEEASNILVHEELPEDTGGLIAVDAKGNVVLPFNSGGMFRGMISDDQIPIVQVWRENE